MIVDYQLAERACQLSADIYLPEYVILERYPLALVKTIGFNRAMVVWINGAIWVGFMGTHNLPSLLSDFDIVRSKNRGFSLHTGFYSGVESLMQFVREAIAALADATAVIEFFGHSRGASQAIICAKFIEAEAQEFRLPIIENVFAFAPARPGDAAFRDAYNTRLGARTFCFQHGADIVPWEPPWILGNRGVGHVVWFDDLGSLPILDPSLARMALYCGAVTYAGWRNHPPQFAQLVDHSISCYLALFNNLPKNGPSAGNGTVMPPSAGPDLCPA